MFVVNFHVIEGYFNCNGHYRNARRMNMADKINASQYEEIIKSASKPVVLEFGADWWPGCRMLRPVVSEVSEQLDTVDFYYVDVDEAGELAQKFGVQSIPTMILIKDGEEANRQVGFVPEEQVKEFAQS